MEKTAVKISQEIKAKLDDIFLVADREKFLESKLQEVISLLDERGESRNPGYHKLKEACANLQAGDYISVRMIGGHVGRLANLSTNDKETKQLLKVGAEVLDKYTDFLK